MSNVTAAPSADWFDKVKRKLFGFAMAHSANTALNLLYTLIQMLIFARLLSAHRYAEIIILTSIGFYLQPIGQASGRASYILLWETRTRQTGPRAGDEVAASLSIQTVLLVLVSLCVPLFLASDDPRKFVEDCLYLSTVLFANFWSFNLQSTAWSVELNSYFARLSLVRRVFHYLALVIFYLTGSLLLFGICTNLVIVVFQVLVRREFSVRSPLLPLWPRWSHMSRHFTVTYVRQFLVSLVSALSELIVLNSPYAILTFCFGVGPVIVAFDSIMKVTRLAMAVTRTLAEIALPTVTRYLMELKQARAGRLAAIAVALCIGASLVPALAVLFAGRLLFDLLLGPNNVVPPNAYAAAAAIIVISGLYQPVMVFLNYSNYRRGIIQFTILSSVCLAAFVPAVVWYGQSISGILGAFAIFFLACTLVSTVLVLQVFRSRGSRDPTTNPSTSAGA